MNWVTPKSLSEWQHQIQNHPLAQKVRKLMVEAIAKYHLLSEGDRILACVSGGKDSSVMLALLRDIQRRAPYRFHLEAVILDQKQPGFKVDPFRKWVENTLGVTLHVIERDTFSIVKAKTPESGTYCVLCSRLRRAILYDFAKSRNFGKLALGHHRDDLNTTFLMNLFFTGKTSSMPAKLRSDEGSHIVIRPMVFVPEDDIATLARTWNIPIIPCNLCGAQENLQRKKIKALLQELSHEIPHIQSSLIKAQSNIKKSHLLDLLLYDFQSLNSLDMKSIAKDDQETSGVT